LPDCSCSIFANSARISSCRFVNFVGTLTTTRTIWSPRPRPLTPVTPSPRIRSSAPLAVPFGILSELLPWSVGISISAPIAACA
jgi:hypothetical protein